MRIMDHWLADAAEMREMDRISIEKEGIPGLDLMEAAGRKTAEGMLELELPEGEIIILCGPGNNGGDGFVIARHLSKARKTVAVFLLCDPEKLKGDAALNYERMPVHIPVRQVSEKNLGEVIERIGQAMVIVDALLGTGLEREVGGLYAEVIRAANEVDVLRIAVDIPSGLSSDSGQVLGSCFMAHKTYAYGLAKIGQLIQPGAQYCGVLSVIDIGIPPRVVEQVGARARLLGEELAMAALPHRSADSHKGSFGHLLIAAGSPGKSGAALLTSHAALRSGVGLVTLASDPATLSALASTHAEAMSESIVGDDPAISEKLKIAAKGKTAMICGPGWGLEAWNRSLLADIISTVVDLPLLLDADALNILADLNMSVLRKRAEAGGLVLTPHPGEAGRLLNRSATKIQADRLSAARELMELTGAHVILKGSRTLIASPGEPIWVCPYGNHGMATGGTGDVLSGLLGGLLAQSIDIADALHIAVCMHALAGDIAAAEHGMRGMVASDLVWAFSEIWSAWEAGRTKFG